MSRRDPSYPDRPKPRAHPGDPLAGARTAILTLLLLLPARPAWARTLVRDVPAPWRPETVLPTAPISPIVHTFDDQIWIVTRDGLARFDGNIRESSVRELDP